MKKASIKNYNLLKVEDCKKAESNNDSAFFGCDQDWYTSIWQRHAGCGPTVVSVIICYINRKTTSFQGECSQLMKCDFVDLMNDVWLYVTPSLRGIPTTSFLCVGANRYLVAKNIHIDLFDLKIPHISESRPSFNSVLNFISTGLSNDIPIAFLALDKGAEELLESWHWVTLISIEYTEDSTSAVADIIDDGNLLRIDLYKWFHTSQKGGGFVSFHHRPL